MKVYRVTDSFKKMVIIADDVQHAIKGFKVLYNVDDEYIKVYELTPTDHGTESIRVK